MFRCDVAQEQYAEPAFLYPALTRAPASSSLADRRAAAAAIFTDPRNGRLPRTLVNRLWQRLVGHGIVANADEMDGRPWSPALLDWLASDFVEHKYDLKHLIAGIVLSRAYQMPTVTRASRTSSNRVRVQWTRGAKADGRAVCRRHRIDHGGVERLDAEYRRRARRSSRRRRRARGGPRGGGRTAADAILRRSADTSESGATSRRT